jgi:hypothetical protein
VLRQCEVWFVLAQSLFSFSCLPLEVPVHTSGFASAGVLCLDAYSAFGYLPRLLGGWVCLLRASGKACQVCLTTSRQKMAAS